MPSQEEIEGLSEDFDAVVILVEDFELKYDPREWNKKNVEVLHFPIPDLSAPPIEGLFQILHWIDERVRRGKRVLIHCLGGLGRSGTVAVAWIMYSQKLPLQEVLYRVRKLRPGAVETEEQIKIQRELEKFLSK